MSLTRRFLLSAPAILATLPSARAQGTPRLDSFEVLAELPIRPSGLAQLRDGRLAFTEHFGAPNPNRLHLVADGAPAPFPTPGTTLEGHAIRVDREGVLWALDMGEAGRRDPVLRGWDPAAGRLVAEHALPRPAHDGAPVFQDFVVDAARGRAFVADSRAIGGPSAIVSVDLRTGRARRLLEGHPSVDAEALDTTVGGSQVTVPGPGGRPVSSRWGVNGIALDPAGEWLYFGPMTGTGLFRMPAAVAGDFGVAAADVATRVARYGRKTIGDGLLVDAAGNVYNTDLEADGIGVTDPSGNYRLLHRDARVLSFPEGFAAGFDGWVYGCANQAHRSVFFRGREEGAPPFFVFRFRPLAPVA